MLVTYFNARGRCDPIYYMLVDAGVEFDTELVSPDEWNEMKAAGEIHTRSHPFSLLPTLTFGHGARGGSETVLAEASAILTFLELKFCPPAILNVRLPCSVD